MNTPLTNDLITITTINHGDPMKLPKFADRLLESILSTARGLIANKTEYPEVADITATDSSDDVTDSQLIDEMTSDLPEDDARIVRICLKNQLNAQNMHQQLMVDTPSRTIFNTKKSTLDMDKRIIRHLLQFRDLISIQPMSAPSSFAYSMHVNDANDEADNNQRSYVIVTGCLGIGVLLPSIYEYSFN